MTGGLRTRQPKGPLALLLLSLREEVARVPQAKWDSINLKTLLDI
jgi:hypothetical protein